MVVQGGGVARCMAEVLMWCAHVRWPDVRGEQHVPSVTSVPQPACRISPLSAPLGCPQATGVTVQRICITRMVDGIFYRWAPTPYV